MACEIEHDTGVGLTRSLTDDELVAMVARLLARAAARIEPRPERISSVEGSRMAAEWRTRLFEEMASLIG